MAKNLDIFGVNASKRKEKVETPAEKKGVLSTPFGVEPKKKEETK